ncbi:MAG: ATP-binding cassette domain-containing protein [Lachnospiraceae bacterium]|nr:ATP-binding cassette domain-containing protein [Lachnospiraceae bacterium]
MSGKMKKIFSKIILPLAFWLGVWQILAVYVNFPLLLPTPVSVGSTLLELSGTGNFWKSIFLSLGRVFTGFLFGCFLGCLLALLTFRLPLADLFLSPAIRVIRATPVVSFILLVYLWVTRKNIPGCISTLMVLPIVWNSMRLGLDSVDRKLLEMAAAYRFERFKTIRLIWLPSLRPYFSSGLATGLGLAWKSGVAAEVICPPRYAIGTELSKAKTALQSPELYAWTVVIILLSLTMEAILRRLLNLQKVENGNGQSSGGKSPHEESSDEIISLEKTSHEKISSVKSSHRKILYWKFSHRKPSNEGSLCGKSLNEGNLRGKSLNEVNDTGKLHIDNLTFSYGDKPVAAHLSLDIPVDGLTALSGPSGCGKTTFLRILAGLEKRAEGSIFLIRDRDNLPDDVSGKGKPPDNDSGKNKPPDNRSRESKPLDQQQVSILFQEDRLLPWRTVREHILDICPDRADEWLAFAELEDVKDAYPGALSGGQARRLALARCCALGGELLLLDEPFAGVDTERRIRILERLKKMGVPMILATHEPDVVAACQNVVYLEGPPLQVKIQVTVGECNHS